MAAMTSKFYYVCVIQYYSDQWMHLNSLSSPALISISTVRASNNISALLLRWLPTVAGQIYIDQCGASPTGKCFEMNDT